MKLSGLEENVQIPVESFNLIPSWEGDDGHVYSYTPRPRAAIPQHLSPNFFLRCRPSQRSIIGFALAGNST